MLNFKPLYAVFLVCLPLISFSQTIKGKVITIKGEPIKQASIIIKDSINAIAPKEFAIAQNGEYTITLKKQYTNIVIEIISNGYLKDYQEIKNIQPNKEYILNFALIKEETIALSEVEINAKKNPLTIKEDTVTYNVSSYRETSDRKIQDIIKKLPGIEVNEKSGEIKYKGQSVEAVTLDGDDLFGSMYSLGTKNINVDIVEQIQAIENYSNNPLLKGIENKDKVALNLVLKKGKIDFSGSADAGIGLFNDAEAALDVSTTVLAIAKKYKSFGGIRFNNIGNNDSPYDYFSEYSPDKLNESIYSSKKIIPEMAFSSPLSDDRANINNQLFGNYNYLFKIGTNASIKTNLYYLKDNIKSYQLQTHTNYINNQLFATSDATNTLKVPTLYQSDLELKIKTTKASSFEYKIKLSQENINTTNNILQNNDFTYQSNLKSKEIVFRNNLLFIQKLSSKNVLQASIVSSINNLPQIYSITSNNLNNSFQYSHFNKYYTEFQSVLLGRLKTVKYSITLGGILDKNPYKSDLSNFIHDSVFLLNSYNNFDFSRKSIYINALYSIVINRFKFGCASKLSMLQQQLNNKKTQTVENKRNYLLEPTMSIGYKINDISAFKSTFSYSFIPIAENYLFNNPVLVSNRLLIKNTPNINFQKITSYSLFYLVYNLYTQYQFNIGVVYNQIEGGYFSNNIITSTATITDNFFLNQKTDNLTINHHIEKFVNIFNCNIRLKSNYSILNYKNIINNSSLRNNKSTIINTELFIKSAFDVIINFENVFKINQTQFKNSSFNAINNSINNTAKIVLKPNNKWLVLISADCFWPNIKSGKENYIFLDASVRYTPKNKKIDISFWVKNILNNQSFVQTQNSDYSISQYQNNLLKQHFICNFSYSF